MTLTKTRGNIKRDSHCFTGRAQTYRAWRSPCYGFSMLCQILGGNVNCREQLGNRAVPRQYYCCAYREKSLHTGRKFATPPISQQNADMPWIIRVALHRRGKGRNIQHTRFIQIRIGKQSDDRALIESKSGARQSSVRSRSDMVVGRAEQFSECPPVVIVRRRDENMRH